MPASVQTKPPPRAMTIRVVCSLLRRIIAPYFRPTPPLLPLIGEHEVVDRLLTAEVPDGDDRRDDDEQECEHSEHAPPDHCRILLPAPRGRPRRSAALLGHRL